MRAFVVRAYGLGFRVCVRARPPTEECLERIFAGGSGGAVAPPGIVKRLEGRPCVRAYVVVGWGLVPNASLILPRQLHNERLPFPPC